MCTKVPSKKEFAEWKTSFIEDYNWEAPVNFQKDYTGYHHGRF